jgi:hypothetical protein
VSLKAAMVGALALVLVGVVALAATREASQPASRAAPTAVATEAPLQPPRPALGPAEQQYVESLWPIHVEVERAAVRVALGAAFYRLKDIDREELKGRLDDAQRVFRTADGKITQLSAPPRLQREHQAYGQAVRMFEASATEMLKMYDDGDEEHLTRGFPMSQQGSDGIREVGAQLFPEEYPPN